MSSLVRSHAMVALAAQKQVGAGVGAPRLPTPPPAPRKPARPLSHLMTAADAIDALRESTENGKQRAIVSQNLAWWSALARGWSSKITVAADGMTCHVTRDPAAAHGPVETLAHSVRRVLADLRKDDPDAATALGKRISFEVPFDAAAHDSSDLTERRQQELAPVTTNLAATFDAAKAEQLAVEAAKPAKGGKRVAFADPEIDRSSGRTADVVPKLRLPVRTPAGPSPLSRELTPTTAAPSAPAPSSPDSTSALCSPTAAECASSPASASSDESAPPEDPAPVTSAKGFLFLPVPAPCGVQSIAVADLRYTAVASSGETAAPPAPARCFEAAALLAPLRGVEDDEEAPSEGDAATLSDLAGEPVPLWFQGDKPARDKPVRDMATDERLKATPAPFSLVSAADSAPVKDRSVASAPATEGVRLGKRPRDIDADNKSPADGAAGGAGSARSASDGGAAPSAKRSRRGSKSRGRK